MSDGPLLALLLIINLVAVYLIGFGRGRSHERRRLLTKDLALERREAQKRWSR